MGSGSGVAVSCGVGHRRVLDPTLLWLWHRPVAIAPTGLLAWEPPYAMGAALKKRQKKKKKTFLHQCNVRVFTVFIMRE